MTWILAVAVLVVVDARPAAAAGITPTQGPLGTTVTVTGAAGPCSVSFDDQVVAGAENCASPAPTFSVPASATLGMHTVRVAGGLPGAISVQNITFTVIPSDTTTTATTTTAPPPTSEPTTTVAPTVPPTVATTQAAPPTTVAAATTVAPATSVAPQPTTTLCAPSPAPVVSFGPIKKPPKGLPGTPTPIGVTWGPTDQRCGPIADARLLFDGRDVGTAVPVTTGPVMVEMTVPDDATAGQHRIGLVRSATDPFLLASAGLEVEGPASGTSPLLPIVVVAAVVVLAAGLVVKKLRSPPATATSPAAPPGDAAAADAAPGEAVAGAGPEPTAVEPEDEEAPEDGAEREEEPEPQDAPEPEEEAAEPDVAPVLAPVLIAAAAVPVVAAAASAGGGDRCAGPRAAVEDASARAETAGAQVEQAQQRARAAERRAEDVRRRLDEAEGDGKWRLPVLPYALPAGTAARKLDEFLVETENPHAPRTPNGKRGWYRTQRATPVRGIMLSPWPAGESGAHDAREIAYRLSVAPRGSSGHVVVDAEGVIGLLPDDHVAIHRPETDEAALVALVAKLGGDQETHEKALRHAADWCSLRLQGHRVPARRITREEWIAGQAGFLDAGNFAAATPGRPGPEFPWDEFMPLLRQRRSRGIPGLLPRRKEAGHESLDAEMERAESEMDMARSEAQAAEQRAREARRTTSARLEELVTCERQGLPSPEDLLPAEPAPPPEDPQDDDEGRYYLLVHENHNASLRDNGKWGWYYPTRLNPIRGIVVHTAESFDAEGIAAYLAAVDRPAAAHVVVDPHATVLLLPDTMTAFHAVGGNSSGLGIEIAYKAALWGSQTATEELLLARSSVWCGLHARLHGIPVRRITVEEWEAGEQGFISHAELDPTSRTDPGPDFPWDRFLELTARIAGRPGGAADPAASPTDPAASAADPAASGVL